MLIDFVAHKLRYNLQLATGLANAQALPEPDWTQAGSEEYVAPATELETRLQAIWHEVLGQEPISMHADFFSVGGNSLQVVAQAAPDAAWDLGFTIQIGVAACCLRATE